VIALPLLVKAALAALLLGSIARAFAGPPAKRPNPVATSRFLAFAGAAYSGGTAMLLLGHATLATAFAATGVEAACASAWLARAGGGDGPDDDGGHGGDEPAGPPPIDWDAFDRARRAWERAGTPV
jgi:hypothetical protein